MDPVWGSTPTRRDPVDLSGVASKPNAVLRIQATSYETRDFVTLLTFRGTATRVASSPDLYSWSSIGLAIDDRFWVPTIGTCTSGGMANLRVQEQDTDGTFRDLATFDAAGRDCVYDHIAAGEHPVTAGSACKLENETIVLFAPPQCIPARTTDPTGPDVTVRLSNSASAWQAASGGTNVTVPFVPRTLPLNARAMVRDRDGAVSRAQLGGSVNVVCRRASDGAIVRVPVTVDATSTQSITAGALAQISLDASRSINVSALVTSTCPAGYAFDHGDGNLFAVGTNAAGASVYSPQISFTL